MTDEQLLRMALEALESTAKHWQDSWTVWQKFTPVIDALRERLEVSDE